ncbi:MAG: 6-pyruvoyl-tetrahydropterin synthase-related protein, partial [Chloroflexota bacterium]
WGILIALLLPIITALPTLGDGIVAGADVGVHVQRIHAITLSLQEGVIYPRWISYFHLGYGYPIFNFYAPLSAYITALLEVTGLHIVTAYNVVQTVAWSFGSLGMYLLARRFFPMHIAIVATALWAFAPSRLYEVWWQGSLAQIVAASFMPYLFIGVLKNSETPSLRRILAIALPYAALIMTHTPMMYITTLYAAPLAFFAPIYFAKTDYKAIFRRWGFIGSGFLLGIGLSTIFLMPTLLELQYVQISEGLQETIPFLREQFLPIGEIFTLPPLIDRTDQYLVFPRTLGLVGGMLSLFGIGALIWKRRYGLLVACVAGLGFTVYMLLDVSFDVWLLIPAFENLRFPARLLRMGAILVALLGSASLLLIPQKYQIHATVIVLLLVIAQVLPISAPYDDRVNYPNISAYDEFLQEQSARTWGTVSYNEFNPIWGERIFLDAPTNALRYIDEPFHLRVFGRDIAATNWQGLTEENITDNRLRVTTDEARAVRFRQYYFPGWQATVNGERAEIYPDEQVGLITIDLPAGEHIVELTYVGTPVQLIATVISWISVIICIGLYYFGKFDRAKDSSDDSTLSVRVAIGLIILIVGIALLNDRLLQPNNWLSTQSAPTEPRHMTNRVDATFGEQIALLGYTLHDNTIARDSTLNIDLYWHVPEAISDNYRPIVQLVSLSQDQAFATSSNLQPAAGEFSTMQADRYATDPYALRLFDTDIPPYMGQIMVQLVNNEGTLPLADGSDRLILEPIIRIDTLSDVINSTWDTPYKIGSSFATLLCATIEQTDTSYDITLGWQLDNAPRENLVVMVQGLDENGELIASGDAPPFDGNYPAWFWDTGQTLYDSQSLPLNDSISEIAVGLYIRETVTRLSVTLDGEPVANNQILLDLEEQSCQP